MKKNIVNLLCLFIPSRNMRYRIRKKLITKTKFEELEESVDMLYYILENCVGVSNIPKAVGKLRKIQEDNIKLIDFFDSLCKKYNLKYWLDFGSLLGAVRHKGFIPWDDDIDVAMPINDYLKFIDIAKKELNDNYKLIYNMDENCHHQYFLKIHNTKTTYIETIEKNNRNRYKGNVEYFR